MKIIKSGKEVLKLKENSIIVLYGAGTYGMKLMCELNSVSFLDYFVCDSGGQNEYISNYISLAELFFMVKKVNISMIITVKDDTTAKVIVDEIIEFFSKQTDMKEIFFFRYIAESRKELEERKAKKGFYNGEKSVYLLNTEESGILLQKKIQDKDAFLFSRWGSVEGNAVYGNRIGIRTKSNIVSLQRNAGVFPVENEKLLKEFYTEMESAAKEIDLLYIGYWCQYIEELFQLYSPNAKLVSGIMYPFCMEKPWTKSLKKMKVLVIHPFAELIQSQYKIREKLFENQDILPSFELKVYKAVQSIGGNEKYTDWIEALYMMEYDIKKIDFDIALIGCGAYGMPLGAFIKSKLRKKAIHIGGTLQILFGIKGKRWEQNAYNYQKYLYNQYWVRPTENLKPKGYENVEQGCYW